VLDEVLMPVAVEVEEVEEVEEVQEVNDLVRPGAGLACQQFFQAG
jgi:hypothetical protein